jgi:hypothetical protein
MCMAGIWIKEDSQYWDKKQEELEPREPWGKKKKLEATPPTIMFVLYYSAWEWNEYFAGV